MRSATTQSVEQSLEIGGGTVEIAIVEDNDADPEIKSHSEALRLASTIRTKLIPETSRGCSQRPVWRLPNLYWLGPALESRS